MDEDRTNTETGDNTEEDEHIENPANTFDESLESATEPQPTGTRLYTTLDFNVDLNIFNYNRPRVYFCLQESLFMGYFNVLVENIYFFNLNIISELFLSPDYTFVN